MNNNKPATPVNNIWLELAKYCLFGALFSVLIVMRSGFFPFIGGKDYFFRITVELALIFTLLGWAFGSYTKEFILYARRIIRHPLFLAVTIFVAVFVLACIFALDPRSAFWSNYERGEGGFQMLHYFAFFVLLVLHLRTKKDWQVLFTISLVVAGLMIAYGILSAYLLPSFVGPYSDSNVSVGYRLLYQARFQGSLGNPAYIPAYLMFSLFYLAYLWVGGGKTNKDWLRNIMYVVGAVLLFIFIILAQTRGAFLGLIAATFIFVAYLALTSPKYRYYFAGLFVLLLVGGAYLYVNRDEAWVRKIPGSHVLNITFGDRTAQTRLWTWNSAWRGLQERPVLGWGPENFTAVFDKYFDKRHYLTNVYSETWFDRAHNVFVDYAAETGILGLLAYLFVFFLFVWKWSRQVRHKLESSGDRLKHGLILSIVVGYLVQGFFLFDVLPIFINLMMVLALAVWLFQNNSGDVPVRQVGHFTWHQPVAILGCVVCIWSAYYGSYLPMVKSQEFILTLQKNNLLKTLADLEDAYARPLDIPSPSGQEELVRNFGNSVGNIINGLGSDQRQGVQPLIDFLMSYYRPILDRGKGPSFAQDLYVAGSVYEAAFKKTSDQSYLAEARRYYLLGLEASPDRPQFLYGMYNLARLGQDKEQEVHWGQEILNRWPDEKRIHELSGI